MNTNEIETPVKKQKKKTFNKQANDRIEWAKWSWNPVTGCLHDCKYCYARDIANSKKMAKSYPVGFEPYFREDSLGAPANTKIPKNMIGQAGANNVFVCSMADLFGKWVNQEWIDAVFKACNDNPQWNYLFLTKNPRRYLTLEFPKTAWVGATGDNQMRMNNALDVFFQLKQANKKPLVTFVSAEPLNEKIILNEEKLSALDWLIIGGQSQSSGDKKRYPNVEWVESLVGQAKRFNVKIYQKPNIGFDDRIKEYPVN